MQNFYGERKKVGCCYPLTTKRTRRSPYEVDSLCFEELIIFSGLSFSPQVQSFGFLIPHHNRGLGMYCVCNDFEKNKAFYKSQVLLTFKW